MSNSFDINVKPEIAAVAADIAANLVQILSNASALATIQVTDLPAIDALIDILDTNIDAIIDNHIPGTNAKVDVNLAAIDVIDGIVDAIKIKTDATPQCVRGQCLFARLSTSNSEFQEVLNSTGQGKLTALAAHCFEDADTLEVRITIDGVTWELFSHTGDTIYQAIVPYIEPTVAGGHIVGIPVPQTEPRLFDIEFNTSLLIEVRRSAGTAGSVDCKVYYTLDAF